MNAEMMRTALDDLAREKGIRPEVLQEAIEAALVSAYKRNFGAGRDVRAELTGDGYRIYHQLMVVEEVSDPRSEISLADARAIVPDAEVGQVVETDVTPQDFGRIAAQTAKQVVVQRLREAERGQVYVEYSGREHDVVTGRIHRIENRHVYIDLGKAEALLPPSEQAPGESYRMGDRIKTYVVEVRRTSRGPQIIVSRTHPGLIRRLFELEVPEIEEGIIEIKAVAREPGMRAKVAVHSEDPGVDPVGACVGPRGMRVQNVVSEIRGEKIDIVRYDENPAAFIANSLSPARITSVDAYLDNRSSRVVVPDNQLSLAIGREGQNARLAAKLTGWKIDIRSESQAAGEEELSPDDGDENS
ncbi:MAG: transcription termination factor NusA [Negativicutes bacterium]|nr:transcription termination factor NusA [Negativicutes bacterium]